MRAICLSVCFSGPQIIRDQIDLTGLSAAYELGILCGTVGSRQVAGSQYYEIRFLNDACKATKSTSAYLLKTVTGSLKADLMSRTKTTRRSKNVIVISTSVTTNAYISHVSDATTIKANIQTVMEHDTSDGSLTKALQTTTNMKGISGFVLKAQSASPQSILSDPLRLALVVSAACVIVLISTCVGLKCLLSKVCKTGEVGSK